MRPRPAVLLISHAAEPYLPPATPLESTRPFARFWPHLSAFRMNPSGSVHSKQLYLPLESTLMKNRGRGGQLWLTRNCKNDSHLKVHPERPLKIASWQFRSSVPLCGTSASLRYPFLLRSELSTLNFQPSTSFSIRFQLPHQPRNNHLPENHRIGPHFHLPPQVPALRIDPRLLRHVAAVENQIRVRNGNLCVQNSRDHQHRRHRLSEQPLSHQRHLRENVRQVFHRFRAFKNRHQRRPQPEQILAISQRLVDHKIFLKRSVRRRRLRHYRFQSRMLQNRQLRRPIRAETLPIHSNPCLVHLRPRLQVVDHTRKFALRRFTRFDRRLSRA